MLKMKFIGTKEKYQLTALSSFRQYNRVMRAPGILILIAISFMIFTPLSVSISFTSESEISYILTLDVCHASDGAGSVNSDLPVFCENTFILVFLESVQCIEPQNSLVLSFDLPFLQDRPPQA